MCQAQQQSASLGYSPMPVNLVTASFDQIAKIPGAEVQNINVQSCNNPTFSPSGENLLAANAPQPQECDRQGPAQCATGTGGVKAVETPTAPPAAGGAAVPGTQTAGGEASAGEATGAATDGGTTAGGGAVAGGTAGGGGGGTTAAGGATSSGGSTSGGAAGSGAATGGVTDGTASLDESAGAPTDTSCDPDTGICGGAAAQQSASGGAVQSGAQVGAIVPTTLDQDSGWGGQETLILVVALLTLGLVFAPAYYWRKMSTQADATPSTSLPAPERQQVSV